MQREEKQLEIAIDAVLARVNDLKVTISNMIMKLEMEHETLTWPNFLDNFALISGQLTALSKVLSHDKCPALRSWVVLPLMLSPERDTELLRLTEQRVPSFAHDLVPDLLRTKVDPDVEQRMQQLETKAANLSMEMAPKQVAAFNKVMNHVWEVVSKAREEWESEAGARTGAQQTFSVGDTNALVAAVGMGRGLKSQQSQTGSQGMMGPGRPGSGGPGGPGGPGAPGGPGGPGSGMMNPGQQQMCAIGKMPSGIKTNIKPASQLHPYNR